MSKPKKLEVIVTDPEGESYLSEVHKYDERGNTIETSEYTDEGIIQNRIVSKFDDQDRLLEEYVYNDGDLLSEYKKHLRKEDGSLEKTEIDYDDGSTSIQYLVKDEEKNIEEWIEEDEDGELETRELVQYNDKGLILSREVFDYRDKLKEVFEFDYDDKGNLAERRQFDHKRKLLLITEYEYDDNSKLVYRETRNRRGVLSEFVKIDYDDKGQVVKQNISGKYTFNFEYDEEGRTVLEERYLGNNHQLEYQSRFEYDEEGRMTKEVNLEFTKTFNYEFYD